MKHLIFILTLLLLASCSENTKHTFHYTNGTVISDTNQINVLEEQLGKTVSAAELKQSLTIQTTLSEKRLKSAQKLMGTVDTSAVTEVTVMVLNNHTGNIENIFLYNGGNRAIFGNLYDRKAVRLYGFLLAFDKGRALSDTFSTEQPDWNVSQSFCMLSGANIMPMPYEKYPLADWVKQDKKLHNHTDFSGFSTGKHSFHKTSLFDMTKTLAAIKNHGIYREPVLIRSVKNASGKQICNATNPKERIISETTISNMHELMERCMQFGIGSPYRRYFHVPKEWFVYEGGISSNNRWCIASDSKYTIGIVEYCRPQAKRSYKPPSLFNEFVVNTIKELE